MRRAAIVSARALLALSLLLAAADAPLPARRDGRIRVHLVDRSGSVLVPGAPGSLSPSDADDIVARDVQDRRGDDVVTWASFGRDVAFESRTVDPSASGLRAALEAALAKDPTEIVLHGDGRADPGPALFVCRERGIPVHVLPVGPREPRDARLVRISAPVDLEPGRTAPVDVVVESTFDAPATLRLGAFESRLELRAGVPHAVRVPAVPAGGFTVELAVEDDCPGNNRASGRILSRTDRRRILALGAVPELPGVDAARVFQPQGLSDLDAVVVTDADLAPDVQERLAAWVRGGGALILAGGPRGLARWQGSALGAISPLTPLPDARVAVVLGVDVSGSMNAPGKLDVLLPFLLEVRRFFDPADHVAGMTFSDSARVFTDLADFRRVSASGGTHLARGIKEARGHLETRGEGRKHIVLFTDGETAEGETPEMRRAEAGRLGSTGLTIVSTAKAVDVGENLKLSDWTGLEKTFERIFAGLKETERPGGRLDLQDHPAVRGLAAPAPARIHRTTLRGDAQLLAALGAAPARDPVVALRTEGLGRVGTLAFPLDAGTLPLLSRVLEAVAGSGTMTLSVDPPFLRARGSGPARLLAASDAGPIPLLQTGPDAWEGRLPAGPDPVLIRLGRARALWTPACPPELEALGVDESALRRLAAETGGRVLGSVAELSTLPRPSRPGSRSGRTAFLAAALFLLFADLAIATFWKPRAG